MTTRPTVVSAEPSRADSSHLAHGRESFLSSAESLPPSLVSSVIHASWQRSRELRVDAERLEPSYFSELDRETPLARNAAPVLLQLKEELANEPIGIILTDASGAVLQRLCDDSGLTRALDGVRLVPGFSYAEAHVGTNGIGTALECRAPMFVNGAEHFNHDLGRFACAGVPIIHPINGALLGALDLTSASKHANPLLLVVAKTAVRQLRERIFSLASAGEIEVFTQYLRACKSGGESIIAFGEDLVMMNTHAEGHFDAKDRAALLVRTSDAHGLRRPTTLLADLPSGITARIEYRPVFSGEVLVGGLFRVRGNQGAGRSAFGPPAPVQFPGIAGTGGAWQQVCRTMLESHRRGEWMVLEGE